MPDTVYQRIAERVDAWRAEGYRSGAPAGEEAARAWSSAAASRYCAPDLRRTRGGSLGGTAHATLGGRPAL